jgi:hypothetical protein
MSEGPLSNRTSRLLKKSASSVLATFRGSTYGTEYASPLRLLQPCWTAFLNSLRVLLGRPGLSPALYFSGPQEFFNNPARRTVHYLSPELA